MLTSSKLFSHDRVSAAPSGPVRDAFVVVKSPTSASAPPVVTTETKEKKEETKPPDASSTLPSPVLTPVSQLTTLGALKSLYSSAMRKEMKIVMAASYQLSTGVSGTPNAIIGNDLMVALSEFTLLAGLFNEFFVQSFEVRYEPVSRYQKHDINWQSESVDFPLHVVSLHHGQSTYPSHTTSSVNSWLTVCNSADPWRHTWRNVESRKAGVAQVASTSSVQPSQGWSLTTSIVASEYTGQVQVIAPSAFTGPTSFLLGTTTVRWEVYFRNRI